VLLGVSSGILATYFNISIYEKGAPADHEITNQVDMAKTSVIAIMKISEPGVWMMVWGKYLFNKPTQLLFCHITIIHMLLLTIQIVLYF